MIGTESKGRPGSRIFYTFRHRPQVPTGDLLQLRHALAQCQEPADEDAASELLRIIHAELRGHAAGTRADGPTKRTSTLIPAFPRPARMRPCENKSGVAASALTGTHSARIYDPSCLGVRDVA